MPNDLKNKVIKFVLIFPAFLTLVIVGPALSQDLSREKSGVTFNFSKSSLNSTYSITGIGSVDLNVDGYLVGTSFDLSNEISLGIGYFKGRGALSFFDYQGEGQFISINYNVLNNLDLHNGHGMKTSIGFRHVNTSIDILVGGASVQFSDSTDLIEAQTEVAITKDISVSASVVGDISNFNPSYGIGLNIGIIDSGYLNVGYSTASDSIQGLSIESTAFLIGYKLKF